MNNNSKRRKAAQHKAQRKIGFSKPGCKKKAKPFPRTNPDADLSLYTQAKIFYGACAK